MTGRERIMTALNGGIPDRVPATPDMSIMIPTRLTGKPSYRVEYYNDPDLTTAYINAAKYFGIDGWMFNGTIKYKKDTSSYFTNKIISSNEKRIEVLTTFHTEDGDLDQVTIYPHDNPGTVVKKYSKDLKQDFKIIRHLYDPVIGYDDSFYLEQKKMMGEAGMICCGVDTPGLHVFFGWMGYEDLIDSYYEYPDEIEEITHLCHKNAIRQMEMCADAGVESILTGGSGSITLQSPEIFRKLSLPTIKAVTKLAKEAGILSGIHSCGKEYALVEACANETDLNYVNPLEIAPLGDCDIADVKKKFGKKLALMGNLHTSKVMLGHIDRVRLEALRLIRDCAEGGGYVLSSGDQCGRDTPEENIFELVKISKEFGVYPIDYDKINEEIARLEKLPEATGLKRKK